MKCWVRRAQSVPGVRVTCLRAGGNTTTVFTAETQSTQRSKEGFDYFNSVRSLRLSVSAANRPQLLAAAVIVTTICCGVRGASVPEGAWNRRLNA